MTDTKTTAVSASIVVDAPPKRAFAVFTGHGELVARSAGRATQIRDPPPQCNDSTLEVRHARAGARRWPGAARPLDPDGS